MLHVHVNQTSSITHLTFPSRSHLISASEDCTLCVFCAWLGRASESVVEGSQWTRQSDSILCLCFFHLGRSRLALEMIGHYTFRTICVGWRVASMELGFGESWTRRVSLKCWKFSLYGRRTYRVVDDWVNAYRRSTSTKEISTFTQRWDTLISLSTRSCQKKEKVLHDKLS